MPKTKKYLQSRNLASYDVYIEDSSANSDYFQISNMPPTFTGGRNSFLIAGSELLQNQSQILIEILDAKGNTIYQTPVAKYKEGDSKLVSVEIYDETPSGFATVIIMGKARLTSNGRRIPLKWQNAYNVRWVKRILVDSNIKNISPIRFLNPPQVFAEENRFNNINSASYEGYTSSFTSSLTPTLFSSIQTGYKIEAIAPTTFSADIYGGFITGAIEINNITKNIYLPITNILNSTVAFSNGALLESPLSTDGFIKSLDYFSSGQFTSSIYGMMYGITSSAEIRYNKLETPTTNIPISYANLRITDLNTVSGELYKIRVYNRVASNLSNYKLIGDVLIRTSEILVSSSIRGNVPIGNIIQTPTASNNWYASRLIQNAGISSPIYKVSGSTAYYNPQYTTDNLVILDDNTSLLASFYTNIPVVASSPLTITATGTSSLLTNEASQSGYFIGAKKYFKLFPSTEYTLSTDAYYKKSSGSYTLIGSASKVDIYLIGSGSELIIDKNPLGQKIGELIPGGDSQWFQNKQFNFSPQIADASDLGLRFVISNGFWNFSNVSIKPATDNQLSPDEVQFLVPNTEFYNEYLEYKVEFFDINSNSANVVAISAPTFFTGSVTDLGILP